MELSRIEVTELPKMLVASYEVTSGEPEQEVGQYMEAWLEKRDLYIGENGVRTFGFDCHKGRSIPRGCRIYHMYASLPKKIDGDDAVEVKEFPGGKFAKIVIRDPFSGDFPSVWENQSPHNGSFGFRAGKRSSLFPECSKMAVVLKNQRQPVCVQQTAKRTDDL